MSASEGLTSWMDLELHSYANVDIYYKFCRVPPVFPPVSQRSKFSKLFIYLLNSTISLW